MKLLVNTLKIFIVLGQRSELWLHLSVKAIYQLPITVLILVSTQQFKDVWNITKRQNLFEGRQFEITCSPDFYRGKVMGHGGTTRVSGYNTLLEPYPSKY